MTTTAAKTEVVRVRVTAEELEWLRQVAQDEDRTVSSVLRLALRQFVEARGT